MPNSSVHGAHALDATGTPATAKKNAPSRQDATCVCVRCIRRALQTRNCSSWTTQMFVFCMYCCSTCHACLLRKGVGDMFKLVGFKSKSQDAPASMTKTADRGRRNSKTNWTHLMHRRSHKLLAQVKTYRMTDHRFNSPFNSHDTNDQLKIKHLLQVTTEGTCWTTPRRHGSTTRKTRKSSV